MTTKPRIIFIGAVGVGKSTICEKIIPQDNRKENHKAGSSKSAVTFESVIYEQADIIIIDTPGTNPKGSKKFSHNSHVAAAFASGPISLLCLVVESHVRMSEVISKLEEPFVTYAPFSQILCPIITKMDRPELEWKSNDFREELVEEYGIRQGIFLTLHTSGDEIRRYLLEAVKKTKLKKPITLDLTGDNFFKYFKVHNRNLKVLTLTKQLVTEYSNNINIFWENLETTSEEKKLDLVFEFQKYMLDQIPYCERELQNTCNFISLDDKDMEDAHLANLRNHLKSTLFGIRLFVRRYQKKSHGLGIMRKCPYCGEVYTKVKGCETGTTCGRRVSDQSKESTGIYYSYTFTWRPFTIHQNQKSKNTEQKTAGCGRDINWSEMGWEDIPRVIST